MTALVIVGAGGHGRVCAEIARAAGWRVEGFCDIGKTAGELVNGLPVLAPGLAQLRAIHPPGQVHVFIAIGENGRRLSQMQGALALGYELARLLHPNALVSPSAEVGVGTVLMPGVIINANTRVGRACIVNTAASLDHDTMLEDGVQICPGVRSAGTVRYGAGAFVGTGAVIIPGVSIGASAVVGAGAVVIRDVPEGATVVGNPARVVEGG